MTNNLNSVIVEGIITECEKMEKATAFKVRTMRYFKDVYGEIHEESSYFIVEAYGKLAQACDKILAVNVGVRVVGRLKTLNYENYRVIIIAEHIEAKPVTVVEDA